MSAQMNREGLRIVRLLMVLSSVSPPFVLWAIRGNRLVRDRYFLALCSAMVIVSLSCSLAANQHIAKSWRAP